VSSGDETSVVAILAMPRLYPLDVTIPAHVFGRHPGYRVAVCCEETGGGGSGPPATDGVVTEIRATHTLEDATLADIVVVPGYEGPHLPVPDRYLRTLRTAHERGARIVGLCTGVFALAAGGLLNGRTATVHWRYAEELRSGFPGVDVLENRLLVEDGRILTSAGASAGIDACLHLVEADFGTVAADNTAREVVSAPGRAPGTTCAPPWSGSAATSEHRSPSSGWRSAAGCRGGRSCGTSSGRRACHRCAGSCCSA
jgi:transcriptional regulator GlxA family with amidase domain